MTPDEIKALLAERGLTQQKLGDRIGITQQAVSKILSGATTSSTARYSVANALGVPVEALWPSREPVSTP